MIFRDGRKIGSGTLDDDRLKELEQKLGCYDRRRRDVAERKLATELHNRFRDARHEQLDAAEHLASWATNERGEQFSSFASGPFIPLFSGDSSHLRNSIVAPMLATLIAQALQEPTMPILGGQGTDTADIALLGPFDALTFDTQLPPLILAGANRSHNERASDAPRNFVDLARVANLNLEAGAYWVFQGNLYKASDFVKIDPEETRRVEGQSTFLSPHATNESIESLFDHADAFSVDWQSRHAPASNHVAYKASSEALYDAFQAIRTHDLGDQNPNGIPSDYIDDPSIKAIIVAGHSLGNIDNLTRSDLVEVVRNGKLVIGTSRTLISATSEAYAASMFSANRNPKELGNSGALIVTAHKLGKTAARALTARALLEGLDPLRAQNLFDRYCRSRHLL